MKASRIVVLLHQLSLTGAPRLTIDILDALSPEASVRVIAMDGGPLVDAARRSGPTVVLRDAGFLKALPRRLASGRVSRVLQGVTSRIRTVEQGARTRRWKPDLVYVSTVVALPLVPKLRLGGIPVVLHVHEIGSALAAFELAHPGLILSVPDRYVSVSAAVANDLVRLGVPSDAISVIPPYVFASTPEALPATSSRAEAALIVGGAGHPSWTKGIDIWLLAAREALDRLGRDRLRFVWVGYRDDEDGLQFRSMISKLGLDGAVELVPETDRPYDQFARFDMFAMTSWEESASLVVLETMAMGVPVICFAPTGGPAEEVGDAGIVISGISPGRMADAIVNLAESPEKRLAMGSACADRARTQYRRDTSLAALTRVFDVAVTSGRHR